MTPPANIREGSLEAPTRHPLDWKDPAFYDQQQLFAELERVYDICHGCRRCVSLCNAFPTLFDLVDACDTFEVDGVAKEDYWKVVDHCYLCGFVLLDQVPLRTTTRMERRLSTSDAARQGGTLPYPP